MAGKIGNCNSPSGTFLHYQLGCQSITEVTFTVQHLSPTIEIVRGSSGGGLPGVLNSVQGAFLFAC